MVRTFSRVTLAALVAALVVSGSLNAQQGRRGGGLGLFGGGQTGVVALAANEAVQKDLNLTDDDKARLTALRDEFTKDIEVEREKAGIKGGREAFQNLSDAERQELMTKMTDLTRKLSTKYAGKLKETLKPEQYERLQQISYQAAGLAAYSDPEVVKALDLSKEQQDKIAAVARDTQEKTRALFGGGGGADALAKMQEIRKEGEAEAAKVLTKEQGEKFAKLKGKEFDVSLLRGGGRPGGRGRPGADAKKAD